MKYWPHKMKMPIGWRTIKTTAAVLLSLLVVDQYGASPAKVVFATIGAMSAVGPTFTASVRECISQICGVSIGALLAILFTVLGVPGMLSVGLGVVGIIALYQRFRIKLAPVLPCLILVNVCLNPDVEVFSYSLGRIWDTAIGLTIGMMINTLVFPYDNSRAIRRTMDGLDRDMVVFLEDLFDGDDHLPEVEDLSQKMDLLEGQLETFAQQRLLRRKRQKKELACLQDCGDVAHDLVVELETLRNMRRLGRLNPENRQALRSLGAKLSQRQESEDYTDEDVVVNYHVAKALQLRQQLKRQLDGQYKKKK